MPDPYLLSRCYSIRPAEGYHALFAASVPYLPSFLAGETFAGASRHELVTEISGRQVQFISALAHLPSDQVAVDLRLVYRAPGRGPAGIQIGFIGRGTGASPDEARELALQLLQALQWALPREYPLAPAQDSDRFTSLYAPFGLTHFAEIRKGESFLGNHPFKYLAYPFHPRPDSMTQVCRALLQSPDDCAVSVCLVPATLTQAEVALCEQMRATIRSQVPSPTERNTAEAYARLPETAVEALQGAGPAYTPGQLSELLSEGGVRMYDRLLSAPHLVTLKLLVVSSRPLSAGILHALGADLTAAAGGTEGFPDLAGYEIAAAQTDMEREWARSGLDLLALTSTRWGPSILGEQARRGAWGRLRYLATPNEASAAFRLPIVQDSSWIGIPTRVPSPFYPTPVYSGLFSGRGTAVQPPDERPAPLDLGDIVEEPDRRGQPQKYPIDVGDLAKHALVVGVTGSGKTTTCMHLLSQLWARDVPFLVIEPAKCEYRALLTRRPPGRKGLLVFTVGDDSAGKLRVDPFRVPPGVSVATHVSLLTSCFAAAFPMGGPLEILLTRAFREAYQEIYGPDDGRILQAHETDEATPSDFLTTIATKAKKFISGYGGELRGNLTAALQNRLEWLQDGAVGRTINPVRGETSLGIQELLGRPTVIELRRLADNNDKALLMALLLAMLGEYYEYTLPYLGSSVPAADVSGLRHVTLIEEAHRLLANVPLTLNPEVANSKGKAIELFVEILAELRSRGEGLVISEQIPTKLVSDVIKNTNLKIMHRITPEDDRLVLGATMNLDDRQRRFITLLQPGQAAVFRDEFEAAVLVQVTDCRRQWAQEWQRANAGATLTQAERAVSEIPDQAVADHMATMTREEPFGTEVTTRPPVQVLAASPAPSPHTPSPPAGQPAFPGWDPEACRHCWDPCEFRSSTPAQHVADELRFHTAEQERLRSRIQARDWQRLGPMLVEQLRCAGIRAPQPGQVYCLLAFLATPKQLTSVSIRAALEHFGRREGNREEVANVPG